MNVIFTILFVCAGAHTRQNTFSIFVWVCVCFWEAEQRWLNDYYYYKFICFSSQFLRIISIFPFCFKYQQEQQKNSHHLAPPPIPFQSSYTCLLTQKFYISFVRMQLFPFLDDSQAMRIIHTNTFEMLLQSKQRKRTQERKMKINENQREKRTITI